MSTLNLQVRLKGPEHLLLFITTLQPGAPQEVFEADAPSAFQVRYCLESGGGGLLLLCFDSFMEYLLLSIVVLRLIFGFRNMNFLKN